MQLTFLDLATRDAFAQGALALAAGERGSSNSAAFEALAAFVLHSETPLVAQVPDNLQDFLTDVLLATDELPITVE